MQSLEPEGQRCHGISISNLKTLLTVAVVASAVSPAMNAGAAGSATNAPAAKAGAATNAVPGSSTSTTDPVLSLLLEKGMITEDEAEKTQAQADSMRTNMAAFYGAESTKWKNNTGIKDLEIYGDLRLRFEDRDATDPGGFKSTVTGKDGKTSTRYSAPGDIDLNRLRYAVRLGLRGDAYDDFYYGFRLETSSNPRSSWVTMGTSSSGTPYNGPFGKSTAGIDVGQIYLGWHPLDWFDVTLGKMPNPLFTSSMVWSPSINPEGAAEHLKYSVGPVDFFGNFGQFLYADSNPNSTSGYFNLISTDDATGYMPLLLSFQGGGDVHITKTIDFKVAPTLYTYNRFNSGRSPSGDTSGYTPDFSGTYVGQGSTNGLLNVPAYYNLNNANGSSPGFDGYYANQTGINDLMVLEIPFEFTVKLKDVDVRLFGDYAQNLEGSERATAAYAASHSTYFSAANYPGIMAISSPQTNDKRAYQFGLALASKDGLGLVNGITAKRHSWEVRTYWQHVEQYSLDPNLIDTDFFEGVENLEGVYVAVAYGFTDNFIGTFRYGHANRINDKLGTGGSGQDIPQMNPINEFELFQVDLTYKF
jgi:hypothetical protein